MRQLLLTLLLALCASQTISALDNVNRGSPSSPPPPDRPSRGLPSADEVMLSAPSQRIQSNDGTYRIGRTPVTCVIADGTQVAIILVDDRAEFLFVAVRSAYGPAILANEWRVVEGTPEFSTFAFFRECAVHALARVTARSHSEAAAYDREVVQAADCMALNPTLRVFEKISPQDIIGRLAKRMREEYGPKYPISISELGRCLDERYVSEIAARMKQRR